jgi:ABC-type transport system involved in multi-copper enzyme maturation permease subunit
MRALASEFQKVFTTRMWWLLAVLLVVYVALMSGGLGALFGLLATDPEALGGSAGGGAAVPSGDALAPLLYSFASSIGYVFPVLLGALAVTSEFRHRTLTQTFLVTPKRGVVLGAKFASHLVLGALFGALGFAAAVAAGAGALSLWDLGTALDQPETWALIARGVLAMALWGAIGVGLGSVVPNQVAAIVIVIAFTQFVEPVVRLVASLSEVTAEIAKFLPGAASDALVGASFYSVAAWGSDAQLDWWQGGLVLAGIAVVLAILGGATTWRRDVS